MEDFLTILEELESKGYCYVKLCIYSENGNVLFNVETDYNTHVFEISSNNIEYKGVEIC